MAISPPSDIVLDVAAAADPAKVRAATERLAMLTTDPTVADSDFKKALARAVANTPSPAPVSGETKPADTLRPGLRPMVEGKTKAYQKFEAAMLQTFIETMLPEGDGLYGDKVSAGAYRSMMAEQLAGAIAKVGGIGIAKTVEKAHPQSHASATPVERPEATTS